MLFRQKVNSRHENINSHYFKHLVFFSTQLGIIFMLSFIENFALTSLKHNLKSRPSFKKFGKGYDCHGWKLNLRWLDTVLAFNNFVLIKYKVLLKC